MKKHETSLIIPEFVDVKGGAFNLGDPYTHIGTKDNKQSNIVITLSDFFISRMEITFEQYDVFCDATGRDKPDDEGWGRGERPVIYVNWHDAVAFCEWMSQQIGKIVRLPTEAEWEYAAKGANRNKGYKYAGSNSIDPVGWYYGNSDEKSHPVAQKQPNELKLYDMSGNVWEWCNDWYAKIYNYKSPQIDPQGPARGSFRVRRGGSWASPHDGSYCRVVDRGRDLPGNWSSSTGFRCVLSP